jgi:hypothetical protein
MDYKLEKIFSLKEQRRVKIVEGKATYCGIEMDARGQVVIRSETHLVIRWPGRTSWGGRGCPRIYNSPEMHVLEIVGTEHTNHGEILLVDEIVAWSEVRNIKDKDQS